MAAGYESRFLTSPTSLKWRPLARARIPGSCAPSPVATIPLSPFTRRISLDILLLRSWEASNAPRRRREARRNLGDELYQWMLSNKFPLPRGAGAFSKRFPRGCNARPCSYHSRHTEDEDRRLIREIAGPFPTPRNEPSGVVIGRR